MSIKCDIDVTITLLKSCALLYNSGPDKIVPIKYEYELGQLCWHIKQILKIQTFSD